MLFDEFSTVLGFLAHNDVLWMLQSWPASFVIYSGSYSIPHYRNILPFIY